MQGPKMTCSQCSSKTSRSSARSAASVHPTGKYSVRLPSRCSCTVIASMLTVAHHPGGERAPVHPREGANHRRAEEPGVRDLEEVLGDPPEIALRGRPSRPPPVEAREAHRPGVGPQGALA